MADHKHDARDDVVSYLYGELSSEAADTFGAQAEQDPELMRLLHEDAQLLEMFRENPMDEDVPPGLLRLALGAAERRPLPFGVRARRWLTKAQLGWGVAAAACAVFLLSTTQTLLAPSVATTGKSENSFSAPESVVAPQPASPPPSAPADVQLATRDKVGEARQVPQKLEEKPEGESRAAASRKDQSIASKGSGSSYGNRSVPRPSPARSRRAPKKRKPARAEPSADMPNLALLDDEEAESSIGDAAPPQPGVGTEAAPRAAEAAPPAVMEELDRAASRVDLDVSRNLAEARRLLELAQTARAERRLRDARRLAQQAGRHVLGHPMQGDVLLLQAEIALDEGNFRKALEYAESALHVPGFGDVEKARGLAEKARQRLKTEGN